MNNLNEACFAYPALRKFPINTKESTVSSYGAYKMQKTAFDKAKQAIIEGNFKKAAAFHEVELESDAPVEAPRTVLMFKGASEGVDMNEIRTTSELNKAIDFILEKRASTLRADLAEPAKYVLWAAANTDMNLDTPKMRKIAHIAGVGVGDREKIQYELEKRATLNIYEGKDKEEFYKFVKTAKELSDEDFYAERNLNAMCDAIDSIDFLYNNQHKHASDLGYPEDVVFADTMDDLLKQASDLYYIPSIKATLSKKATLERKDAINRFLGAHFSDHKDVEGDDLINKMASLDENTAEALIKDIE